MPLSAAVWPQFWKQSCCLQLDHPHAELSYRILALIVAFDIAASPYRVWDCSHFGDSRFYDRKSDAGGGLYDRLTTATAGLLLLHFSDLSTYQEACM